MKRALFVTNGHGEASIGERIAQELARIVPALAIDHLALVGEMHGASMADVGPRKPMPSGGLVAMFDLRNIARDLRHGLLGLTLAQYRFLRAARGRYDACVAIGDVYAQLAAGVPRAPTVFVGTAKSVRVAPYGAFEERVLRGAAARFVRDEPTAQRLSAHGVQAQAANVIVDLFATPDDGRAGAAATGFEQTLALLPGSRDGAYGDARFLLAVVRRLASSRTALGALLSIAANLDAERLERDAAADGWTVERHPGDAAVPFELRAEQRVVVRAWRGELGPLLSRVHLVLGQAGTANEAAAAAGIAVVAFERETAGASPWYRRRQRALLGDALCVLPAQLDAAATGVAELLDDPDRRARMGEAGRRAMGPPGGALRIARTIAELAGAAP